SVRCLRKFRLRAAVPRHRGAAARLALRRSPLRADQLIHPEDRLMRLTMNLPLARSRTPSGRSVVVGSLMIAAAIALVPSSRAQTSADAVYAVTYLDVGTTAVTQGVDLIKKYRDLSRREAANLEFTVLQEASRPNRFVIMEGWKDQATFETHDKGTAKAEFEN